MANPHCPICRSRLLTRDPWLPLLEQHLVCPAEYCGRQWKYKVKNRIIYRDRPARTLTLEEDEDGSTCEAT